MVVPSRLICFNLEAKARSSSEERGGAVVASRARVLLEVGLMRSGAQAPRGGGGGGAFSKRTLSGYMRIMSSGASTAASSLLSVGASLVNSIASHDEDGSRDQVQWAGFDKLECGGDMLRQVLHRPCYPSAS